MFHTVRVETLLVCTAVALLLGAAGTTWHISRVAAAAALRARAVDSASFERAWLARTYGPSRHSQFEEESIIRDFFQDRRGGIFVDVGAAHARELSTTYFLEKGLGWSGLAVEPQAKYAASYQARPRTRLFPLFISDQSDRRAILYVTDAIASGSETLAARHGETREQQVPTITLDDLLARNNITTFDFLSMDIEWHEPQGLAGFTLERHRPKLVCIEAHPEVRQAILDYFTARQYVVVGKYLRVDTQNIYFMPAGTVVPAFPVTGETDAHDAPR